MSFVEWKHSFRSKLRTLPIWSGDISREWFCHSANALLTIQCFVAAIVMQQMGSEGHSSTVNGVRFIVFMKRLDRKSAFPENVPTLREL